MEYTITEQKPTRALLVEADTGDYDAEASLAELFELTESAGAIPVLSCRPSRSATSKRRLTSV